MMFEGKIFFFPSDDVNVDNRTNVGLPTIPMSGCVLIYFDNTWEEQ